MRLMLFDNNEIIGGSNNENMFHSNGLFHFEWNKVRLTQCLSIYCSLGDLILKTKWRNDLSRTSYE